MRLRECLVVAGLLAGWAVVKAVVVGVDVDVDSTTEPVDNDLDSIPLYESADKSLEELCAARQAVSCLKLTLLRRLGRFSRLPSMELLPGLTVSGNMTSLQQLPSDVTADQLDEAMLRCLTSLSVTVRVVDGGVMQRLREIGATLAGEVAVNNTSATGRRRPGNMMMAGLVSGGSMMALGMSAVAMMAGKALLAALMSLMLSAMAAMKSGGGGGGKSSYEVVHAGHDFKHRSIEVATPEAFYPYAARRNIYIPLHQQR